MLQVPLSDDHAVATLTQEGQCFARTRMEFWGANYAQHHEIRWTQR